MLRIRTWLDDGYDAGEIAEELGVAPALVEALLRAMSGESLEQGFGSGKFVDLEGLVR